MDSYVRLLIIVWIVIWSHLINCPTALGIVPIEEGSLISDDETETAITEWTVQLFQAAGLTKYKPKIYLVASSQVNAGASVGGQLIIYTGLIKKCKTLNQFLGVLAHEVGHIAGGHVSLQDAAQERALGPALAAMAVGGVAALASGNLGPLVAGVSGGAHVFVRGMLKFSRAQEQAADQAALTYLDKLNISSQGLLEFLELINRATYSPAHTTDPYTLTHPQTSDRIMAIRLHTEHSPFRTVQSTPAEEERFQMIKAKLIGFLDDPLKISHSYPPSDNSNPAYYARSIAYYRSGMLHKSLQSLNHLSQQYPHNAYFHELKGQTLFSNGQISEAIEELEKAISLKPHSSLLKVYLAQALVEANTPETLTKAMTLLETALKNLPEDILAWRLLATTYGKKRLEGEASYCLAEAALLQKEKKIAEAKARHAVATIKNHPELKKRAEDILARLKGSPDS